MTLDQMAAARAAATNPKLFVKEVAAMRDSQKHYFKTKDRMFLVESKNHETIVDEALRLIKENVTL